MRIARLFFRSISLQLWPHGLSTASPWPSWSRCSRSSTWPCMGCTTKLRQRPTSIAIPALRVPARFSSKSLSYFSLVLPEALPSPPIPVKFSCRMKDEDVGIEMQVLGNDLSSRVSIENQSDDQSCANSAFSVDYPEQIASTIGKSLLFQPVETHWKGEVWGGNGDKDTSYFQSPERESEKAGDKFLRVSLIFNSFKRKIFREFLFIFGLPLLQNAKFNKNSVTRFVQSISDSLERLSCPDTLPGWLSLEVGRRKRPIEKFIRKITSFLGCFSREKALAILQEILYLVGSLLPRNSKEEIWALASLFMSSCFIFCYSAFLRNHQRTENLLY